MSSGTAELSSIPCQPLRAFSHQTGIRKGFLLVGVNKPPHRVSGSCSSGVPGALSRVCRWVSTPQLSPLCMGTGQGQSWWGQGGRSCVTSWVTWWAQPQHDSSQAVSHSRDGWGCATPDPGDAALRVLPCFGRSRWNPCLGCLKGIRKRSVVRMRLTCFQSALK